MKMKTDILDTALTRWMVSASLQRWRRVQSKANLLLEPWSTATMMSRPLLLSPVSLPSSGGGTTGISDGSFTSLHPYSSSPSFTGSIACLCCRLLRDAWFCRRFAAASEFPCSRCIVFGETVNGPPIRNTWSGNSIRR